MRQIDQERLAHVEPDLVRVVQKCLARGNKFVVTYGLRTVEEQAHLYAQGRTEPGNIVTWTMNSRHLPNRNGLSEAVDLAPVDEHGNIDWENLGAFDHLAAEMKAAAAECGVAIERGADFKRPDRPHFQLAVPK